MNFFRFFVGFIPHNQDEFMTSMKEIIETHKKEQQVKQQQVKQQMVIFVFFVIKKDCSII